MGIRIDVVDFDDYQGLYVDGSLVEKGSSISMNALLKAVSGKTVDEANLWFVDSEDDMDTYDEFASYDLALLTPTN